MINTKNIPPTIASAITHRLASLTELGSVLGLEDLWDLLEIAYVNSSNEKTLIDNVRSQSG